MENQTKWMKTNGVEEQLRWLEVLIPDKEDRYAGGWEFLSEGILVNKEDMSNMLKGIELLAKEKGVAVAVFSAVASRNAIPTNSAVFGVETMIMIGKKKTLTYLNLDEVPVEYQTKEWLDMIHSTENGRRNYGEIN